MHLWWLVLSLQVEQNLHIEETLSHLSVNRSQEVERQRQLENELVHHDEVSNSHGSYKQKENNA